MMNKKKAQLDEKRAERKQECLYFCIMKQQLTWIFLAPGLDAGGGSALGPRGNSSLHTPSTFFQQEKYYPQKKKYTMKKKSCLV